MRKLNLTIGSFGSVSIPVTALKEDLDHVAGDNMRIWHDSREGTIIWVDNPIIELNDVTIEIKFSPKFEYRKKKFLKRYHEIAKYPDVDIQIKFTEKSLSFSYKSKIGDTKIEGKFTIPAQKNDELIIKHEDLPYSVKLSIKHKRLGTTQTVRRVSPLKIIADPGYGDKTSVPVI